MPQFKVIIFDLDNTLLDFMELKKRSCEAAVTAMINVGLKMKKKDALSLLFSLYDKYGIEDHIIFQRFLRKATKHISYPLLAAGIVAYRNIRSSYLIPYPNIHQTLQELQRRGLLLCILTDAPRLKAWMRIAALQIIPYFSYVITYDDTKAKKPSPKPFQKLLYTINHSLPTLNNKPQTSYLKLPTPDLLPLTSYRQPRTINSNPPPTNSKPMTPDLRLSTSDFRPVLPWECLMVGDMVDRDIKGAQKLGIKTCLARYGARKKYTAKADYIIDDVHQLLKIC